MTEKSGPSQGIPAQHSVTDDLDVLLGVLPPAIVQPLQEQDDLAQLLEIVLDMGRLPTARFLDRELVLTAQEVTEQELDYITERIGAFGQDNRAGIERTLHRISAILNRKGKTVGLTCRVGRAVFGTIRIIEDLVASGKSILLLGRPGVGKTTMLREVARVLAEQFGKRVVVVDTSNEIAGDGDIPHPGIGRARRMQVPTPALQHEVMIEAVENHMPEVIIIDEIGRELETQAARTIAERGVQLVATAHGNNLENLINNPTLADLIGGIQSVTLGDEEARRRGTQKSILERKAPPTFDVVVEIQNWGLVVVHEDVAQTVDAQLRGRAVRPEERSIDDYGEVKVALAPPSTVEEPALWARQERPAGGGGRIRVYAFGVNRGRAEQVIRSGGLPIDVTGDVKAAQAVLTTKAHYRNRPQALRTAEGSAIPVYVLRKNTSAQIEECFMTILGSSASGRAAQGPIEEAELAAQKLLNGNEDALELSPQNSYIRRLQHQVADQHRLVSRSSGREPFRRVRLFRTSGP